MMETPRVRRERYHTIVHIPVQLRLTVSVAGTKMWSSPALEDLFSSKETKLQMKTAMAPKGG
jgi:hypothetical protein